MKRSIIAIALSVMSVSAFASLPVDNNLTPVKDDTAATALVLSCKDGNQTANYTILEQNHQHMMVGENGDSYVATSGFDMAGTTIMSFAPLGKDGQVLTGHNGINLLTGNDAKDKGVAVIVVGKHHANCTLTIDNTAGM